MQSGWLRQFFHQHDAQCGHGVEADATAEVKADDDVSRRDFVKTGFAAGVAAGMAAGTMVAQTSPAQAQPVNPMGRTWWPSPWGPTDEKGAYNRQTPAKAMEAARLVKTGRIYPLSQALEAGIRSSARGTSPSRSPVARRAAPSGRTPSTTTTRCSAARSARWARSSTGWAILPSRWGTTSATTTDSPRNRSEAPTACRSSESKTSAPFSPVAS